jgi:hypothetical protein
MAIANMKVYLTTKEVAMRYGIDPRSVQRRVKLGLLPPAVYLGTRFPRWHLTTLEENERRLASVRVANAGVVAIAAKRAAAKQAAAEADDEAPPKTKRKTRSKTPAKPAPRRRRADSLAEHEAASDR